MVNSTRFIWVKYLSGLGVVEVVNNAESSCRNISLLYSKQGAYSTPQRFFFFDNKT
jgi:hypothetical protein